MCRRCSIEVAPSTALSGIRTIPTSVGAKSIRVWDGTPLKRGYAIDVLRPQPAQWQGLHLRMDVATRTALVVIDAQRAFVDPAGSLIRTHGAHEAQPGLEAFQRLRDVLGRRRATAPTIFVRSEYHPGQFTNGRLDDGMASVCVPGRNIDCQWAHGVEIGPRDIVVTKYHADAGDAAAYREVIEQAIAGGATSIALAGFQFTTCVAATAVSTASLVRGRGVGVAVIEPLTGSRASSHVPDASGVSRMDSTRQLLARAGVDVIAVFDGAAWAP
jgi:nicotinamidase-related amidase